MYKLVIVVEGIVYIESFVLWSWQICKYNDILMNKPVILFEGIAYIATCALLVVIM